MNIFISRKIAQNTNQAGEQLRQTRLKKNIKIAEAAKILNINHRYLDILENGQWEKLPAGVYGKNFLRRYASFLGIDADWIIAVFNDKFFIKPGRQPSDPFSRKKPRSAYFINTPKMAKNIVILIIVLVCTAYLGYGLKKIISPPRLEISSPQNNFTTKKLNVDIKGTTEPGATVIINGEPILINASGQFSKLIGLKNGLNTIFITAQKKYSKKNSIIKKILVNSAK